MKTLLVAMNAKYIHSNLGIYCIRSYGIAHGIPSDQLELAEYTINQNRQDILADIYRRQPGLVAFSCYIWNISQIIELAAELHKVLPQVPIWFGGPEVSYHADSLIDQYPWLTGIMVGEGEATFLEVYQMYETQLEQTQTIHSPLWRRIPGLVYGEMSQTEEIDVSKQSMSLKTDRRIVQTEDRPKLSMDEIVFPYEDMEGLEHRIVYYETSRGCPFGCSYCLSSVDRQVRLRSMELVEKELQFFLDKKVPQVKFVDRTFNCQREHTMAIWKYIYEHDNGITNFHFELSADLLTDEEIEYLRFFRPGLVQFEIGVQSTNPDTMKAIRRSSRLELLQKKVQKVHQARNIHQHLDLIAGLPYEDYESFRRSFHDVYCMRPDQLQLGFLKVLKGSPMEMQQEQFGIVHLDQPPYEVLYTKWLSYGEMLRLKQVEDMVERYYNSMQFEASIPYAVAQFAEPFDFYQSLGEYYQKKGYQGLHQSRLQNYEILLEFCETLPECDITLMRQLLLYDLYARENLKARPEFLTGVLTKEEKDWNRRFYQDETVRQHYLPEYEGYDWKQVARMTHLEHFTFNLVYFMEQGKIRQEEQVLLFDYRQRNPLNHQAAIIPVDRK